MTKPGERLERDTGALLVKAMASHQLRLPDKALAALTTARDLAKPHLAKLNAGEPLQEWVDWIIVQALLREATALIEGHPVAAPDAGP